MAKPEILLEQSRDGRPSKKVRVAPDRGLYVIGSSPTADLRLPDLDPCHVVLEYRSPNWVVRSFDLEEDRVRVNDASVSESVVLGRSTLQIGRHKIELFAREQHDLFRQGGSEANTLTLHQAVVLRNGHLIETVLLEALESFRYHDGSETHTLPPPTTGNWIDTKIGGRSIRQRLVSQQEILAAEGISFDRELKKPFALAAAVLAALAAMILTMSLMVKSEPQVVLDQKSRDVIFNAQAIQKRRVEAKQVIKTAKAKSGVQPNVAPTASTVSQPDVSQAPVASAKAQVALTSLRNAGLSSLVGKVAKRANKSGILVATQGVAPDQKGAGRAFFSTGTSTSGGGGQAATAGPTYRLGGVATAGRGGGAKVVANGTALAGGTIGTGDVALVDEETVIEGGLDRDVIAEVIKRNLGQIRYCYERQLSSNPDLYGKLLVQFTIGADGNVMGPSIGQSTLKSAMVEGCVLRRVSGWRFPLPKGGTQVRVSYPFLFKALD
jgi:outer membrane biosynthesis protein TonB